MVERTNPRLLEMIAELLPPGEGAAVLAAAVAGNAGPAMNDAALWLGRSAAALFASANPEKPLRAGSRDRDSRTARGHLPGAAHLCF